MTALFISVDPERDTAENIKQYVSYYNKHLIDLTESKAEIEKIAQLGHVPYRTHPHKPLDTHYLVDHSASLYVINAEGELNQIVPFALPVEHIQKVVNEVVFSMK